MVQTAPLGAAADLFWDDYGIRTAGIPVDLSANTAVKIRLFTVPVLAGDLLVITGEINVTNDVGRPGGTRYTCGIGCHLWIYDANAPAETRPDTWIKIGSQGENVPVDLHHLVMNISRPYRVPAAWEAGHQIGVVLMADAHSTAWNANGGDDKITVEGNGTLMCTRTRVPVLVDDPRWAELNAGLTALTAGLDGLTDDVEILAQRVDALEPPPEPIT